MKFTTIIVIADNGIGIYTCHAKLEHDRGKFINLVMYTYANFEYAKKELRRIGLFSFGAAVIDQLRPNEPYFKKPEKSIVLSENLSQVSGLTR